MTRQWLFIFGGLIGAVCSSVDAWGRNASRPDSLITAIGRTWTEDEQSAGGSTASSTGSGNQLRQSSAPKTSRGLLPSVGLNPLGLLPGNLLGGGNSQAAGSAGRSSGQRRSPSATGPSAPATSARTAARPRAGSATSGETFHDSFMLPGLGSPADSPEDRSKGTTPAASDTRRDSAGDYPGNRLDGKLAVSGLDDADHTQTGLPAADDGPAGSSPDPRTSINFDSSELRRELVSAYPVGGQPRPSAANVTPLEGPAPEAAAGPDTAAATPDRDPYLITLPADGQPIEAVPPTTASVSANTETPAARESTPRTSRSAAGSTRSAQTSSIEGATGLDRSWGQNVVTDSPMPDVLVTNQTPVITSDILGPKQILIGREADYRVRLRNDGDVPADELVAEVRIPSWADVLDTTTSRGTIQQSQDGRAPGTLQWQIQRLEAHASETLSLKLVPRTSRPLELGITWTCAAVGSRAVVEVQEPKLQMHISGPDEVLFGKPQIYRLTLINPGTGVAENVKIDLLPPGGGEDAVSTHRVGDLSPGRSQSVEVELTPRDAGKLYVKALASADGGLSSEAAKEIFCRKPELAVDWRGPESKYAGTAATYFFRVRNPGTATADDVSVVVTLPEGMELASASEGQAYDPKLRSVIWRVGSLGPGDDYYMELKGTLRIPGTNQLRVSAETAAGDVSDSKLAETKVVALADLTLDVSDPPGPVAVGAEAVYEIRIANRGASAAEDINAVALFSEGIEPETAEGAQYSQTDGRVTFRTIDALPAGRQIVLRVHARGTQPGTHVFRAEVLCKDLDIKLAAEETTRFFTDELVEGGPGPEHDAASLSEALKPATR